MFSRLRLISSLLFLMLYLYVIFPLPSVIITVVCIGGYLIFSNFNRRAVVRNGRINRRKSALYVARAFLSNYNDNIWENLRLSNSYCMLKLIDTTTIFGYEKGASGERYRKFVIIKSTVYDWEEVWNLFCQHFNHNTTYDALVELCIRLKLVIEEKNVGADSRGTKQYKKALPKEEAVEIPDSEKIDVNNATEEVISTLPGISVIMAKKIVKRRKEINGFKNVDELCDYLKLKPHIKEQLQPRVRICQIKEAKSIKKYEERNIDL